mmetsp:Transcript_5115/g.17080  ORF Transcript_5115/g.17080 Transcript_5115/m.17080 type:complete len:207 (-) Transcript_5115:406-1026(-)
MLAFDPRLHEAAPPALPQRSPPPEARSRPAAPALASAAPALAAATLAVAATAATIAATAAAVAAAVRLHLAAQHLRGDEGAEAVRVLCGRQRRDAVGVSGSEEGAVAEAEEQPLHLPAERVALEHVDDSEEVDALAVRRRNAALLEQRRQPAAAAVDAVDADEQRVVERALLGEEGGVGGDHLRERRLVALGDLDGHRDVEPLPVA